MAKSLGAHQVITKFSLMVFSLLPIASCYLNVNKRNNPIIPGEYNGVDGHSGTISTYLKIEKITEEAFVLSKGVNVFGDEVGGGFYSLLFTFKDASTNESRYDFINLADAYNGSTDLPISYVDDNQTWLNPHTSSDRSPLPYEKCVYSIHITGGDGYDELYSYLYPKGVSR